MDCKNKHRPLSNWVDGCSVLRIYGKDNKPLKGSKQNKSLSLPMPEMN